MDSEPCHRFVAVTMMSRPVDPRSRFESLLERRPSESIVLLMIATVERSMVLDGAAGGVSSATRRMVAPVAGRFKNSDHYTARVRAV